MKKHKSIIIVAGLILLSTGAVMLGNVFMQKRTESTVQAQVSQMENVSTKSPENVSIEFAKELLEDMPEAPLLQENDKEDWGDSSLENCINDVNATTQDYAKEAILKVCDEAGIDAATAKVKDLTPEQIAVIDHYVYEHSEHPKD